MIGGVWAVLGVSSLCCTALVSTAGLSDGSDTLEGGPIPGEAGSDVDAGTTDAGPDADAAPLGAPRACAELMARTPRPASGVYRLDPDGAGPGAGFDAYCELDPAQNGGGWTLLLKIDGAGDRFAWASPLWTNSATFGESNADLDDNEAKLAGFSTMPFTQVRVGMFDAGQARWIAVPVVATSLLELFTRGYTPTPMGRAAWRSLVASPSTQALCEREGFDIDVVTHQLRIGMVFNNEDHCDSVDSFVGIGSSFGVTAGNFASAYDPDDGVRETKVFAAIMIR